MANEPKRETVLVVEDEEAVSYVIRRCLETSGFAVIEARDGETALKLVEEESPDLILLDVKIPRMDGFEVCRRIKEDLRFQHIPILMLTALTEQDERVKGLDLGASDYVVKPFNVQELLARVRTTLRRSRADLDASPLTRLPGNSSLERVILSGIQSRQPFAILYVDLNGFKAYNDHYGFSRGDEVIRRAAKILQSAVLGGTDFLGHVGGDDFVVVTTAERAEPLCKDIIFRFDAAAPGFYDEPDRRRGYIETENRQGARQKFPILSVAIGAAVNRDGHIASLGMASRISAELKSFAKKNPGSSYVFDRRHGPDRSPPG